ncbi:MAG TPA: CPCC family cysteine-rich protein [Clostridia bacterium]|nr:CPCC family cysteine-rich protein [Clostridia bacterium]
MYRFPEYCACCDTKQPEDTVYAEICGTCGWQHDIVCEENPDETGGANRISLNEAIENYKRTGRAKLNKNSRAGFLQQGE